MYLQKCIAAATEGRWDELIKQLSAHLDLVFAKSSDKGETADHGDLGWWCCRRSVASSPGAHTARHTLICAQHTTTQVPHTLSLPSCV